MDTKTFRKRVVEAVKPLGFLKHGKGARFPGKELAVDLVVAPYFRTKWLQVCLTPELIEGDVGPGELRSGLEFVFPDHHLMIRLAIDGKRDDEKQHEAMERLFEALGGEMGAELVALASVGGLRDLYAAGRLQAWPIGLRAREWLERK